MTEITKSAEDLKWEAVKSYYERAYNVQFREKLPREKVEFLHAEMLKLFESFERAYRDAKPHFIRYVRD